MSFNPELANDTEMTNVTGQTARVSLRVATIAMQTEVPHSVQILLQLLTAAVLQKAFVFLLSFVASRSSICSA